MAEDVLENGSSRGEFLARGAGIAGLAVGAGVWAGGLAQATEAEAASDSRSFVSGHFALELDGILIGLLKSMDGGAITAEVVETPVGDTLLSKKHIGNIKYEDFTLQCGFPMTKAVLSWINASWAGKVERKSGAVQVTDSKFAVRRRIEFDEALLSEVRIPMCDASSKDPAFMTLKFAPEVIRNKLGKGKVSSTLGKSLKTFFSTNFKFTLGDLPTKRVSKIDAFTIKQGIVTNDLGGTREPVKEPAKLEFPNLKVTFSEADIGPWNTWFEDMVLRGNVEDEKEKKGQLVFLAPNLQTVLCTLDLFNVGIFKLSYDGAAADSDKVKRVTAELYVERMEIKVK